MVDYFDTEMRQRVKDVQCMLDWNEYVTLGRHGIVPLLELVVEALDQRRKPTLIIEGGWLVQKRPDGTAIQICMLPDPEAHPEMFPDDPDDADKTDDESGDAQGRMDVGSFRIPKESLPRWIVDPEPEPEEQ